MKNGWYVYKPDKRDAARLSMDVSALVGCGKQVVQVIEGTVWLTGVSNKYTVEYSGGQQCKCKIWLLDDNEDNHQQNGNDEVLQSKM